MTKGLRYSWVVLLCLGMAPVLFLAVRHWVHLWYFLLLFAGLAYCISNRPRVTPRDVLPILTLAAPFIAELIAQALRGELLMRSLDSPGRLLCAIPIYFLIRDKLVSGELKTTTVLLVLIWSSSLALLTLPFFIDDARTLFYGGRLATLRVDTNTLGSYIGVFIIIVFLGAWRLLQEIFTDSLNKSRALILALHSVSLAVGLDMLLQTQSRGAWIAFVVTLVTISTFMLKVKHEWRWKPVLFVMAIVTVIIANIASEQQMERMKSIPTEVLTWLQTGQQETSGGIRLSMISMSLDLFLEKPIRGYGEKGYAARVNEEDFTAIYGKKTIHDMSHAGPHNGILDQALSSGVFGILAGLILYLAPIVVLLVGIKQKATTANVFDLALKVLGVAFFLQILLLQFTINPYGLRMLASFNGIMLALFMAFAVSQRKPSAAS